MLIKLQDENRTIINTEQVLYTYRIDKYLDCPEIASYTMVFVFRDGKEAHVRFKTVDEYFAQCIRLDGVS